LTVSKFFSPSGAAISARGITPHVLVPEDLSPAPLSLTLLRPALEEKSEPTKLITKNGSSGSAIPTPAWSASRPNFDPALSNPNPTGNADKTLNKGLEIARDMAAKSAR
jgi:C-terminal processing protease CtpA/Prc